MNFELRRKTVFSCVKRSDPSGPFAEEIFVELILRNEFWPNPQSYVPQLL